MVNDHELLARLRQAISPDEIAQVMGRIMRVPEAWNALHEADLLEKALQSRSHAGLTPAGLALLSIGLEGMPAERLAGEMEERLTATWQAAFERKVRPATLPEIGLAAIGLCRSVASEGAPHAASMLLRDPEPWRSTAACAWPYLPEPQPLLRTLLAGAGPDAMALAVNALLANHTTEDASAAMIAALGGTVPRSTLAFLQGVEPELSRALSSEIPLDDPIDSASKQSTEGKTDGLLDRATVLAARGAEAEAAQSLQIAWDSTRSQTAEIAEAMADLAEREGNSVLAMEAHRQSFHFGPSPARRARLALSLVQAGRAQEALRALPSSERSPEEHLAAAAAARRIGDMQTCEAALRAAADLFREIPHAPLLWLERLAAEADQAGLSELSLQVLARIVHSRPSDASGRARHARALFQAAEYERGASEAAAALLLSPGLLDAERTLASCLQHAGQPADALEHWKAIAERDPDSLACLGECALAAGDLATAETAARSLLEREPRSAAGRILSGEILSRKGDVEGARAHFEEATRNDPANAAVWIALAGAQSASGDAFASGATLTHAAQLLPQEPALWAALAEHHRSDGQMRQALEAIERALRLAPGRADWLTFQGELLISLGHADRAQSALREALSRRPGDTTARLALAQVLEAQGKIADAADLILELREGLPAQAYLAAMRIAIRHAEKSASGEALKAAEAHLARAQGTAGLEGQIAFWSGRLHEAAGRHAAAFESYRQAGQQIPPDAQDDHLAVVLGLARTALATGQAPLALATLEAGLERHPTSVDLHVALSQTALAADLGDRALNAARQAAELSPDSVVAIRQLASVARAVQDWETAASALRRLLTKAPGNLDVEFELAEASLRAGDKQAARGTLASILWNHRESPDVLRRGARLLISLGIPAAAQAALRRASALLPKESPLWRDLAQTSEEIGDLETAQKSWQRCSEIEPEDVEALSHAAASLSKLGRRSAAIGLWQRSVALEPHNPHLHRELARAYIADGETGRGLNHFSLAIQAAPTDVQLAYEAGAAALRFGALQEAHETLQHASRLAPHDPEIICALAQAQYRLGRAQDSLATLAPIARRDDLTATPYAVHALAASATGDRAAANSSLQRALRRPVRGAEDAAWVSRAALRLGDWSGSVAAFDRIPRDGEPQPSMSVRLNRLAASIRALEAHAILSLADVRRNLPDLEALRDGALSALTALREAAPPQAAEADAFSLRLSAAAGSLSDGELAALKALTAKESEARALTAYGIALIRRGQFNRALEILGTEARSLADGWASILRGVCLAATGQHASARHAFDQASGDPALGPAAMYLAAGSWHSDGRPEQAIGALNAALAAWPDEPLWHHRLASLYMEAENLAAALPHLQHASELDPADGRVALAWARALRADGQISEAKSVYSRVLESFPTDGKVWKEAGEIALALGEAEVAVGWLERACTLAPSDAHTLLGSAHAHLALGRAREAVERAKAAARLSPEDPAILLGLGEILAKQGKLEKALEAYDKALAHASRPLPVQLVRCRLLARLGRADVAADLLEELASGEPENDQIWSALAEAREAAGDEEAAIEAATRAARLAPRNSAHHLALARLSRKTGQLDRALDEVHQAQVLSPADPAVHLELGAIYEDRREVSEALQAYQKAIGLNQNSSEAHFRAGVVLKSLKSYSQAARMFRRAVDLNPKDAAAAHQLAAVRALELVHGGTLHSAVPT